MQTYVRRLQKIASSLLISLPKVWVIKNDLDKGSTILIEVNQDNSLTMTPSTSTADSIKEVSIPYPPTVALDLTNLIYGAYLLGYDIIRIRGKSPITYEDRELIRRTTRKLVGLEIVDEDGSNIVSQFLLDANTLDPVKILRRMNGIVAGMYHDSLNLLDNKEKSIALSIASRDDEVDRQYFLLVRLIRSAIIEKKLATKLNLSNIDILDYRIAANHLETAGDYISDLISSMYDISTSNYINTVVEAQRLVLKMQEKSISAFINQNIIESADVVRMYDRLKVLMKTLNISSVKDNGSNNSQSAFMALNLIYSLDKIAKCWVDVADLVKPFYMTAPLK
jgi:phosphate uptake regulator